MARPFYPADDLGILDIPADEVLSTMDADGKRRWLYPTESRGRYWMRRLVTGWALIALFVLLPVVRIGGKPAVLLDVATRQFTFFGATFYPTDTLLLLLLGVSIGVSVILFTALLGRVWCGWACPQTVYLEFVFRPIERLVEGPEHVRRRRDLGGWTFDKAWRKAVKLGIYLVLSLLLAHTFVAYFTGWDRLLVWMTGSPTEHWGYFVLMAGTTGLVLFNFGYFREQMCTLACPYARIQSVLLDPDSLIVSYDPNRGEPRGKRKKGLTATVELGDCIDCYACVRTCPTGIDIRDGLQMECIACTQCIDACDDIMDKIDKPRGLIRYTSENELENLPTRKWRGRTVGYGLLLVALTAAFTTLLVTRSPYDVNVGRSVGAPFTELPDGRIANRLRFRVRNQQPDATTFTLGVTAPAGAELRVVGPPDVALDAGQMKRVEVWVVVPRAAFRGGEADGRFVLRFSGGPDQTVDFPLLGPG